jgi:HK97 family phage prohead protease
MRPLNVPLTHTELELHTADAHGADATIYTYVARSAGQDRNGSITDPDGWDFTNYLRNPLLFANHDHRMPIGRAHRVWMQDQLMWAQVSFADTAQAHTVKTLVDQDLLRAISIGWHSFRSSLIRDKDGWPTGVHSHQQELVELSIVAIPADTEALRVAALATPALDTDAIEIIAAMKAAQI